MPAGASATLVPSAASFFEQAAAALISATVEFRNCLRDLDMGSPKAIIIEILMPAPHIDVQIDNDVARITVCNETKLNTLTSALMEEFIAKINQIADHDCLRAAVLTGAGSRAFIGGA